MLKLNLACAAAALALSPFTLMPQALSRVDASVQPAVVNVAAKADRLDLGARDGACAEHAWPYYDSACLYDHMRPAGEVHKVRLVQIDGVPTE
jgi:hypothetical protein